MRPTKPMPSRTLFSSSCSITDSPVTRTRTVAALGQVLAIHQGLDAGNRRRRRFERVVIEHRRDDDQSPAARVVSAQQLLPG